MVHHGVGTGLGRERPQIPLSEHRPDTHLGFRDNRLTGMEMGFPILGGYRLRAGGGGTAMRCPRQKTSPCQAEILAPTPKFRAQQRKQLKRSKSEHMSTTPG